MKTALLLIDLQNDFCPGGALAVTAGDAVIPVANQAIAACLARGEPVVASRDWHPANHRSFAVNSHAQVGTLGELEGLPQVWWPVHCVQGSHGADFHPGCSGNISMPFFAKGGRRTSTATARSSITATVHRPNCTAGCNRRASSGWQSWAGDRLLRQVQRTGCAGCRLSTQVIVDGCRGVNLQPDDSERALQDMARAGAQLVTLSQFLAS